MNSMDLINAHVPYVMASTDDQVARMLLAAKYARKGGDRADLAELIDCLVTYEDADDPQERYNAAEDAVTVAMRMRDAADSALADSQGKWGDA